MRDKIIKDICQELNISFDAKDMAILQNTFYNTVHEVFDNNYSHAQLHYLGDRNGWNNFVLPIDCIYISRVNPRVAYKVENGRLKTLGSDKIYLEYISSGNTRLPIFKEIMKQRIKDYFNIQEENS